jgi:hypothetical protein
LVDASIASWLKRHEGKTVQPHRRARPGDLNHDWQALDYPPTSENHRSVLKQAAKVPVNWNRFGVHNSAMPFPHKLRRHYSTASLESCPDRPALVGDDAPLRRKIHWKVA